MDREKSWKTFKLAGVDRNFGHGPLTSEVIKDFVNEYELKPGEFMLTKVELSDSENLGSCEMIVFTDKHLR